MLAHYQNSDRIAIGMYHYYYYYVLIMLIRMYTVDPHMHKWARYGLPVRDPFAIDDADLGVTLASCTDDGEVGMDVRVKEGAETASDM